MKIVGQGARQRLDQIVTPVLPQLDIEDVDLEHVTGFGALDRNRAGEDVAGDHALVFGVNVEEFGRDVELVAVRHHVGPAAHGVDGDSSPLLMVRTGFSLASKKPQWQVSGLECR